MYHPKRLSGIGVYTCESSVAGSTRGIEVDREKGPLAITLVIHFQCWVSLLILFLSW